MKFTTATWIAAATLASQTAFVEAIVQTQTSNANANPNAASGDGVGEVIVCPCSKQPASGSDGHVDETGTCHDDDFMLEQGDVLSLCLFTAKYSTATLQSVDQLHLTDSLGHIQARQIVIDQPFPCDSGCIIETPIWLDFFGALSNGSTISGVSTANAESIGDGGHSTNVGVLTVNVMATVTDETADASMMHYDTARVATGETMVLLNADADDGDDGDGNPRLLGRRKSTVFTYSAVFGVAVLLQTSWFLVRYNFLSWKTQHCKDDDERSEDDPDGFEDMTSDQLSELSMRGNASRFGSSRLSTKTKGGKGSSFLSYPSPPPSAAFSLPAPSSSMSLKSVNSVDDTPRISNSVRKTRRISLFDDIETCHEDEDDEVAHGKVMPTWDEVAL